MPNEHWRYFLALEEDVERTTRFVEPHQANYRTFSIEFARLLLSTCSEIEVVAKVLCEAIAPGAQAENMDHYRSTIGSRYPKLHTVNVRVHRFGLAMEPWKEWGNGQNPGWWRDHQKVKHSRHLHYALADLEHCVVAAAALYSLALYLCHDELIGLEPSRFFSVGLPPGGVMQKVWLPDFAS